MNNTNKNNKKVVDLYSNLHKLHGDSISADLSFDINNMWDVDCDFFYDKDILEAGCGGMGTEAILLISQKPKSITVVDLSTQNIDSAQKNVNNFFDDINRYSKTVEFKVIDLCADILPKNKYQLIHQKGVFQHLKDKDFALTNFNRSLQEGGFLLESVYTKGALSSRLSSLLRLVFKPINPKTASKFFSAFVKSPDLVSGIVDHLYVPIQTRYTLKTFNQLLDKHGFEFIKHVRQEIDFNKSSINYSSKLFRFYQIWLAPNSKHRIKWLSLLLFGSGGLHVMYRKYKEI